MKNKICWGLALCSLLAGSLPASSQSWMMKSTSLALKGGESVEVVDLYWVFNCKSALIGLPEATIMDGPPAVTATVVPANVVPRSQQCSKPVAGGKLFLKAGKVDDESNTTMVLRLKYNTKDGPRENSLNINIALFPSE